MAAATNPDGAGTATVRWYLTPLLLIPIAFAIWAWRSGTDADRDGVRVRALLGQRQHSRSQNRVIRERRDFPADTAQPHISGPKRRPLKRRDLSEEDSVVAFLAAQLVLIDAFAGQHSSVDFP